MAGTSQAGPVRRGRRQAVKQEAYARQLASRCSSAGSRARPCRPGSVARRLFRRRPFWLRLKSSGRRPAKLVDSTRDSVKSPHRRPRGAGFRPPTVLGQPHGGGSANNPEQIDGRACCRSFSRQPVRRTPPPQPRPSSVASPTSPQAFASPTNPPPPAAVRLNSRT